MVFTSSASIAVRQTRLWLWPWERYPEQLFQVYGDDSELPSHHDEFFSNYAASKKAAECLVRDANGMTVTDRRRDSHDSEAPVLRTGCIRPGNGVFGPGGDVVAEAYLVRKINPCFARYIIQSHIYVELDRRTTHEARAKLQAELGEMRGVLKKLRERTKGEFACFRKPRSGTGAKSAS